MNSTKVQTVRLQSANQIRLKFTSSMSDMYQHEVPLYKKLLSLAKNINQELIDELSPLSKNDYQLLNQEHHGAIRLGSAAELFMIRRLFNVMGMHPVDYYDLSVAGIPVDSTAFRALTTEDLEQSPFRIFCSLLRLDLIDDGKLRAQAHEIIESRNIIPKELLKLIEISEKQGGLNLAQADSFVENALEVFRWHKNAKVDKQTYEQLKAAHGLVADIVSFKGPHINHLTPKILDIDACQSQFAKNDIKAKAFVEGPPRRKCPILLRQTSFVAIAEDVIFTDGEAGTHTARFGEVEQRGIALTPKGRELYDKLLLKAKNGNVKIDYIDRLNEAFVEFPDSHKELRNQELAYYLYEANLQNSESNHSLNFKTNNIEQIIEEDLIKVSPITYQDFLPVSAAGIFNSNLAPVSSKNIHGQINPSTKERSNRNSFEEALGVPILDGFKLYESVQNNSLSRALKTLGINS